MQLKQASEWMGEYRTKSSTGSFHDIVKRIDRTFNFLLVRVVSASCLTNKGPFCQVSNPYCLISAAQSDGKNMCKTRFVSGNVNPRWDEEFFIPLVWKTALIQLHIKDDQRQGDENNLSLGYLDVKFRELKPGVWHTRKENLWSLKKQVQKKSEVVYEILFSNSVSHLRGISPPASLLNDFQAI